MRTQPKAASGSSGGRRYAPVSLTLLLVAVLLTGCWDRTELNDVAFVLASSADAGPDNTITTTGEYPIPAKIASKSGGGDGKPYVFIQGTGVSVRDSILKAQRRMARKNNISHRRVFVIGEELAKRGIRPIFDQISRTPDNRLNGIIIIAQGKGADLLHGTTPIDEFSWEGLREIVKGRGHALNNIKNVAQAFSSGTVDPVIVYMGIREYKDGGEKVNKHTELLGYAQFKGDKMIGTFTDEQILGIHWLTDQFVPHDLPVSIIPEQTVTLRMLEGRSHLTPVILPGNRIRYDLKIKTTASIAENYGILEVDDIYNIKKLSDAASKEIQKAIESTFAQMQEQQTDCVGFGNRLLRKNPRLWFSTFQKNWSEAFAQVDLNIVVETSIIHTGLTNNNIAKEEKRLD